MARRLPEATSHGVEAQILLGCARAHLEPGTRERIARLVGGAPDWSALIELADSHALLPLLYRHLNEVAPASVPQRAMIELWGRHEVTARRNRSMAGELVEIVDALDANGVVSLPYKGPALAVQLYADLALREFCDLDILVRARDVASAKEILRGLGYLPEYPLEPVVEAAFLHAPSQYHLVLARPGGTMVELHWKTDADFPIERGDDDGWWAGLERARFGDRMLRAFGASELLLVLCLHGSKHGWGRLAWLADVGRSSAGTATSSGIGFSPARKASVACAAWPLDFTWRMSSSTRQCPRQSKEGWRITRVSRSSRPASNDRCSCAIPRP